MTTNAGTDDKSAVTRAALTATEIEVIADDVRVRSSGRIPAAPGASNVVAKIGPGTYNAYRQCAGTPVTEGSSSNYYWVDIDTHDTPAKSGWISAVFVGGGEDDYPQLDKEGNIVRVRFYGECEDPPFSDPDA